MIPISPHIAISEDELQFTFVRSSGPGGQNVNKVSTAVQLRFNAVASQSLPPDVRDRLMKLAGRRLLDSGEILIDAQRFRTQERNRQDALDRLIALIRAAIHLPKKRRPTKPSTAARKKRIEYKRRRGEIKRLRGPVADE